VYVGVCFVCFVCGLDGVPASGAQRLGRGTFFISVVERLR
jgi:hypothetical protein